MQERNISTLSNEEAKKAVQEAMQKLGREDYEVIYELYFKNSSIRKLSHKLHISRHSVRYRRDRALKRLKEIILSQAKNH